MSDFEQLVHDEAERMRASLCSTQEVARQLRQLHEQLPGGMDAYGYLFGAIEKSVETLAQALVPLIRALETPPTERLH